MADDVSPTSREVLLNLILGNAAEVNRRASDDIQFASQALRLKYTEGVGNVDQEQAVAARYIQGPHPYFGSPDAAKA